MPGVYGGLIVILLYGVRSDIDNEEFLITQNDISILTNSNEEILVEE